MPRRKGRRGSKQPEDALSQASSSHKRSGPSTDNGAIAHAPPSKQARCSVSPPSTPSRCGATTTPPAIAASQNVAAEASSLATKSPEAPQDVDETPQNTAKTSRDATETCPRAAEEVTQCDEGSSLASGTSVAQGSAIDQGTAVADMSSSQEPTIGVPVLRGVHPKSPQGVDSTPGERNLSPVEQPKGKTPVAEESSPTAELDAYSANASDKPEEAARWRSDVMQPFAFRSITDRFWEHLQDAVGIYCDGMLPLDIKWDGLDATSQTHLLELSPKAKQFVEGGDNIDCRNLWKSWIWRILYNNLFSLQCKDKWSGRHWRTFGELLDDLTEGVINQDNPSTFACHMARSNAAAKIYMHHGEHSDPLRLKNIILSVTEPVRRLREADPEFDDPSDVDYYNRALENMVRLATKIDLIKQLSPFNIAIDIGDPKTGRTWSFPYDKPSGLMGDITNGRNPRTQGLNGCPVDMVCSPLLRVYGHEGSAETTERSISARINPIVTQYHRHRELIPMTAVVDAFPDDEKALAQAEAAGEAAQDAAAKWRILMELEKQRVELNLSDEEFEKLCGKVFG